MMKISTLFRNRNFIFLLAVFCGILASRGANWTEPLVIPGLAVVMTISTLGIPNSVFRSPRHLIIPALKGIIMNYILLASVIIALSSILIRDESLWKGFILIAAVPPAVAVIPFAAFLEGDKSLALFGTLGAYLAAFIILPIITLGLIGVSHIDPVKLAAVMFQLILIPLLVSRLLLWKGWQKKLERPAGLLTNWSFFIVLYTIIGLNRTSIAGHPLIIIPVAVTSFAVIFLMGYLIEHIGKFYHVPEETLTSLTLLGTLKNYGLSGGLALTFFNREASLPSAMGTIFLILYAVWLDFRKRKKGKYLL